MSDARYLRWPFFDDHHRKLAAEVDAWCESELSSYDTHSSDVDSTCADILAKLARAGWLRYVVPRDYGGVHNTLDVRSICLIRETLARTSGLADFVFAMQGLGSGAITLFGTEDIKARYLPAVADGKLVAAFALTERETGSDVAAMTSSARDEGDFYIINGTKTFISNGGIASFYTLFVRTGESPGARGISAFVIDADTPGLTIAERIEVMAPHPLATLKFTDCKVPRSQLLGKAGDGFKTAMGTLDIFRSTVGAAAIGFARRAFDEALDRATSRKLFGATLFDLQLTQAALADMAVGIDAAMLLIYRAAWLKDAGQSRITQEAAMAKLFATETAQRIIDKALQIFGGMGVVSGVTVERLYREIRALRIYEGASEVQKLIIAKQALVTKGHE